MSLPDAVNPAALLRVDQLSLKLGGREILSQVSLEVSAGEIVTVIGPNGAGKTTLLRVALGLLPPTAGKVWRQPGLRIGYVPQRLQLDSTFPMSVSRFLALARPRATADCLAALETVGAAHLEQSPLLGLSGGEMQRVLLARALLREPGLLVLDEPSQGIDVHGQLELFQLLGRLRHERGCAILLVSHDLHMVMAATDRVICINRHICCAGTPAAVSEDPAFLAIFGPMAARTLAVYSHDRQHRHGAKEPHDG